MSDPEQQFLQDNIGYRQKAFMILTKPEAAKCLYDKTTRPVLDLLKQKPMTGYELEEALNKSEKTIYRYLKKLEEAGLVIKAGKRIINKDGEYKTYTLYSRTARIYYDQFNKTRIIDEELKIEKKAKHRNKIMGLVSKLLGQLYDNRKGDYAKLWGLYKDVEAKKLEYIEKLLESADEEMLSFISTLNAVEVTFIMEMIGFFAIISEKDWETRIKDCFK